MSLLSLQLISLLAVAAESQPLRAIEFDLPETPGEWALYAGGFGLVLLLAISVYLRDTATLSAFWKVWLTALRFAVLAALVLIAVNPQERTQKMSFRPSRVALLVDTSLSMRYPQRLPSSETRTAEDAKPRSRALAVTELLSGSSLIEKLREQHEISLYTFDSVLSGPHHVFRAKTDTTVPAAQAPSTDAAAGRAAAEESLNWAELLRPRGLETRLGESLLDAMRQLSGRTLSGVVVISDGASNAGIDYTTANDFARSAKVRLLSVGVGSIQQPVNLQIANVQAPTDVHIQDSYEIVAFVQGQGLAGRSVQVELLMRPEGEDDTKPTLVTTEQVTLREDGIPVEVRFQRTPSVAGSFEFFVRARTTTTASELTDDDNERRKTIRIADRKTRVLLVAGGPMRDYRFVRNMLFRHAGIDVDVWLQSVEPATASQVSQESDNLLIDFPDTAAELYSYDVVIAFDPDWKLVPPERLKMLVDWVSEHAGGLILVAGEVYTPELASATEELKFIQELYPVFLYSFLLDFQYDSKTDQAWPIDFTREGHDAGFLRLTDDALKSREEWREFGGVYRCYPTAGAKAGATVYARSSDPRSQNEHGQPILLASQFYGSGRTLYLGSAEIWRLRALSDEYYDRFWTKVIREVGQGRLKRGTSRGTPLLERNEYLLGQTIRVRALLLDPQMEPLDVDAVVMEVFDPNGKPLVPPRRMLRDKSRPGQYVGDFRASLPGTYRIEVPIPESKASLKYDPVDVVLPSLESDNTRQDARLLNDLVRDTGGKYLPLEETEKQLALLLPNRSEEFLVNEQLGTLWDRQWVLYLLVGLLTVEWLTRKLLKLA